MIFKLSARVNRSQARVIRHALERLAAKGSVRKQGGEFVVEAKLEGASAKELNRMLLSSLRKTEKRTTLRAEWTSGGNLTEKFFDYVLKKRSRNQPAKSHEPCRAGRARNQGLFRPAACPRAPSVESE